MTFPRFVSDVLMRGYRGQEHDAAAWLERVDSHDGFERQAAIEAIGRLRHGPAVRALLNRANDWVPQVRAAARQVLVGLLDDAFLADWLGALDAVVALARAERADHKALLESIAAFLGQARHMPAVLASAARASAGARRYAFGLQWTQATDEEARFALLRASLTGDDVKLATDALRHMAFATSAARGRALIGAACSSKFAHVRAGGLRQALARPDSDTPSLARAMCLDRNAWVRVIAYGAVQAQGDAARVIRDANACLDRSDIRERDKIPALQFLWLADRPEALRRCEALRQSPLGAVRRVAFGMLLAAASQASQERWLLAALADPSVQVQRLAVDCLRRGATVPPAHELVEIGLRHGTADALSRALSTLRHLSTWTRLMWLLQAWEQASAPEQKAACIAALDRWEIDARRNFVSPTSSERIALRPRWQRLSSALPDRLARAAQIHLQAHGLA